MFPFVLLLLWCCATGGSAEQCGGCLNGTVDSFVLQAFATNDELCDQTCKEYAKQKNFQFKDTVKGKVNRVANVLRQYYDLLQPIVQRYAIAVCSCYFVNPAFPGVQLPYQEKMMPPPSGAFSVCIAEKCKQFCQQHGCTKHECIGARDLAAASAFAGTDVCACSAPVGEQAKAWRIMPNGPLRRADCVEDEVIS